MAALLCKSLLTGLPVKITSPKQVICKEKQGQLHSILEDKHPMWSNHSNLCCWMRWYQEYMLVNLFNWVLLYTCCWMWFGHTLCFQLLFSIVEECQILECAGICKKFQIDYKTTPSNCGIHTIPYGKKKNIQFSKLGWKSNKNEFQLL